MILVVILLFHDKKNKKLYKTIFSLKKLTLNHTSTILQQYINYTITISVVRLMSVCCPFDVRSVNGQQTKNKRTRI